MRGIVSLLTRNWTLKLAAFGLALLLWIVIRADETDQQSLMNVPVRVQVVDPAWALARDPSPGTVEIRVEGPARDLLTLRPTLLVPVDRVTTADTTLGIQREWVLLQGRENVTVQDIVPSSIGLSFERVRTVAPEIVASAEGELPEGLALAATLRPEVSTLRASGPASAVADLRELRLEPLDLTSVTASGTVTLAIDRSFLHRDLVLSQDSVPVAVLVETSVERVVADVIVLAPTGSAAEFQVLPAAMPVTLVGAPSVVERVGPGQLRLIVDTDGLDGVPPGWEGRARVRLEGVPELAEGRPAADSVTVRRGIAS